MYAGPVQSLIDELGRMPGIGPKSAQRIAFHLLKLPKQDADRLARAITEAKERVTFCRRCFNVCEGPSERETQGPSGPSERETQGPSGPSERGTQGPSGPSERETGPECDICADTRRDATVVCVVEEPRDVVAVEKTHEFRGRYHVLGGAITPLEGVGPDQLRVKELLGRIDAEGVIEVILCTNPNIEGEATAMYLARLLKPLGVRATRIASGLPVGGDLEYADELTLGRALEGRRELEA